MPSSTRCPLTSFLPYVIPSAGLRCLSPRSRTSSLRARLQIRRRSNSGSTRPRCGSRRISPTPVLHTSTPPPTFTLRTAFVTTYVTYVAYAAYLRDHAATRLRCLRARPQHPLHLSADLRPPTLLCRPTSHTYSSQNTAYVLAQHDSLNLCHTHLRPRWAPTPLRTTPLTCPCVRPRHPHRASRPRTTPLVVTDVSHIAAPRPSRPRTVHHARRPRQCRIHCASLHDAPPPITTPRILADAAHIVHILNVPANPPLTSPLQVDTTDDFT
ncbi:hypothetical protein B0H19DRAFT_1384624 [Mycena capillaripes]|nr:hypothetical protein B0H19DRAFT_1385242 [Mycena capillaripes]KAJ6530711.1 hypothetical protein B0H19DRAFT_1384624 [Mycena capillaripes]